MKISIKLRVFRDALFERSYVGGGGGGGGTGGHRGAYGERGGGGNIFEDKKSKASDEKSVKRKIA